MRSSRTDATGSRTGSSTGEDCRCVVLVPGALVALSGRFDVHASTDVRLVLAEQVALGEGDLVLDLSDLESVDPTGLGVLVGAHRQAGRAGRVLVLQDVRPSVGRLLLRTRLHRVLRQVRTSRCA